MEMMAGEPESTDLRVGFDRRLKLEFLGCIEQIAAPGALPVVHTAELLDWATGGPKSVALQR